MMNSKSFEITHFSYRHWNSYHPEGCYKLNLIFRIWDIEEYPYMKQRFLDECSEWKQTEIVTDIPLYERYRDGIRMLDADTGREVLSEWRTEEEKALENRKFIPIKFVNENNLEREDVYTKGYQENWNSMFKYIEKFDCFQFYEYFKINSVTKGIIEYIEELKEIENPDTYYSEQFYHAIKCLEHWWD
jgi:hypothetical protein